jgi:hypothetical protein
MKSTSVDLNSRSQKMFVVKSSKTVHTVTHKDMVGSAPVVVCVNWVPSLVPSHAKGITGRKNLEIVLRQEVPLLCLQKSKMQQENSAKFHVNSIVSDEPFYFPLDIEFILISVFVMKGRRLTPTLPSYSLMQWAPASVFKNLLEWSSGQLQEGESENFSFPNC